MTTYNGGKFVNEQISSILSQSISDFELIICDDCSIDNTIYILQEYAKNDSRIKIYQNKETIGFLKNFEKAISLCSGEFIACCDQDDIWSSNHLETLLNNLGKNDCIGANAAIIDESGNFQHATVKDSLSIDFSPNNQESIFKHECFYNLIQGTACLFKKTLVPSIIPFPKDIKFHDHWIALNASILNGCNYISEITLNYRVHSKNVTGIKKFNIFHAIETVLQARRIRQQLYAPNIAMLKAIRNKVTTSEKANYIASAQTFFENLSSDKKRLSSIFFYIKNYNDIALCSRKKWKLFLYRIFCLTLFGIML